MQEKCVAHLKAVSSTAVSLSGLEVSGKQSVGIYGQSASHCGTEQTPTMGSDLGTLQSNEKRKKTRELDLVALGRCLYPDFVEKFIL